MAFIDRFPRLRLESLLLNDSAVFIGSIEYRGPVIFTESATFTAMAPITFGSTVTVNGQLKTDTIVERTTNAGVTIEGVLMKDNQLCMDVLKELTPGAGITVDGMLIKDGQPFTDLISEATSGAGVTIDGVLMKDSAVMVDLISEKTPLAGVHLADPRTDTLLESTLNAGVTIEGILIKDSQICTDTIKELTPGAGVTIEGVLIKDGQIPISALDSQPLIYKGFWDARNLGGSQPNGNPPLMDGGGTNGDYYLINQADSNPANNATLNGNATWGVGDAIVQNGGAWQRLDHVDDVVSVNGKQGAVVLDTDDLLEGVTNKYYTEARFDNSFSNKFTTDLQEGTNLYWTDSRFDTRFSSKSTNDLPEGSNLYFTNMRWETLFSVKTTDDLPEGSNLYYTNARHDARWFFNFTNSTTDGLSEGATNKYYTEARVAVNTSVVENAKRTAKVMAHVTLRDTIGGAIKAVPVIESNSFGISSVTKNTTNESEGSYTVTFTSAMSSTHYAVSVTCESQLVTDAIVPSVGHSWAGTRATGSVGVRFEHPSAIGAARVPNSFSITIHEYS